MRVSVWHVWGVVPLFLMLFGCSPAEESGKPFVTVWSVGEGNRTITLPTDPDFTYDYRVEWGDGTADTALTGRATHTYLSAGTYTVNIRGIFPHLIMASGDIFASVDRDEADNAAKLIRIDAWGDIVWYSMANAFAHCANLKLTATDKPNLTHVTSLQNMFAGAEMFDGDIGDWNVSGVTDMSGMFYEATHFNQPLQGWDVSHVTTMRSMFAFARAFDQSLERWDVSAVTDMTEMFKGAAAFNQPVGSWDVSHVTSMAGMFETARAFDQPLCDWNVSRVTDMRRMFRFARSFTRHDLRCWDAASVTRRDHFLDHAGSDNQEPEWVAAESTGTARVGKAAVQ